MANTLLTDSIIAKEALMIVENNLAITRLINRRYESRFAQEGKKIGDTLSIRYPVRVTGRSGEEMQIEDIEEQSVDLKIDQIEGQDLSFSNVDLTLSVENFRARYLDTSCAMIANKIDRYMCTRYLDVPNFAGTPGTVPTALTSYFDAGVTMSDYGVPPGDRSMVISPRMQAEIVRALQGLFQAAAAIAEQYKTGTMGHVIGFDWYMDQNIRSHTVGALGGTPLVNGANQSGSTLVTDGWTNTTGAVAKGDIIDAAGANGINPQGRDSTGNRRQFTVTAAATANGSGQMTINISPSIVLTGAYQNVEAAPSNDGAIRIFGHASSYASTATRQGLAFHKEWLTAAFVDLELPKGMAMSARAKSNQLGLSIRIVKGYDIKTNKELCRLDVLFGAKQMYGDFACRVVS